MKFSAFAPLAIVEQYEISKKVRLTEAWSRRPATVLTQILRNIQTLITHRVSLLEGDALINDDLIVENAVKEFVAKVKSLQRPGIEPGPPAWQARILPLNQRCLSSNPKHLIYKTFIGIDCFVDSLKVIMIWGQSS